MSGSDRFYLTADDAAFAFLSAPPLRQLFALLNRDGEEVRVVGGAVRNALMGEPVGDVDCATTAEPSRVVAWAEEAGIRAVPTGIDHGTVTLVIGERSFEVTSLRVDVETDGRHAQVAFGRDWLVDAQRRDFTMNALYVDEAGRLYDPTGQGIEDARARRVRFIGDASRRIAEDYLRILRYFRFFAHYGQELLDADYHACIAAQGGLGRLSAERVGAEMGKLLAGPFAPRAIDLMLRAGMLPGLMGGVPYCGRFRRLVAVCRIMRIKPEKTLLMVALGAKTREDVLRLTKKWRLTNREREKMLRLANHWRDLRKVSESSLQKLAYLHDKPGARDIVLFAIARRHITTDLTKVSMLLREMELWTIPNFPLTGRDLLERGVKPGPGVGQQLRALEALWLESNFELSRGALLSKCCRRQ